MRTRRLVTITTLLLALSGCGEENLERADFNAYFYYPESQREEYLGLVKGISACQAAAGAKARSLNMTASTKWQYICCKKTPTSSCESKHR
jgi:hypothetical protein